MHIKYRLLALLCATALASGCASNGGTVSVSKEALCFLTSTVAGTGAGMAINNEPEAGAIGMVVGGAVGYFLCSEDRAEAAAPAAADADGDGVADSADRCPGTPRGIRVDANGCPLDSDGDGVVDGTDQCPNTPRGTPVNSVGCPLDSDGDGVTDDKDQCPDTPRGQKVDARGCHVIFSMDSLEGVTFAFNSSELTSIATSRLDEAVEMLKADTSVRVLVEGHTDSTGADAYNMDLSQRRAESVVRYLTANGIQMSRLSSVGRGESSPVADNDTDEGRARNRRVDFIIQ